MEVTERDLRIVFRAIKGLELWPARNLQGELVPAKEAKERLVALYRAWDSAPGRIRDRVRLQVVRQDRLQARKLG